MPPQITCASAIPGKMGKHENFTQLGCLHVFIVLQLRSDSC